MGTEMNTQDRAALVAKHALALGTHDDLPEHVTDEWFAIVERRIEAAIDAALAAAPAGEPVGEPEPSAPAVRMVCDTCGPDIETENDGYGPVCKRCNSPWVRRMEPSAPAAVLPEPEPEPMPEGEREYLHGLIQAFDAVTDPEAHPELCERATAVLANCDKGCVPLVLPSAPQAGRAETPPRCEMCGGTYKCDCDVLRSWPTPEPQDVEALARLCFDIVDDVVRSGTTIPRHRAVPRLVAALRRLQPREPSTPPASFHRSPAEDQQ